MKKFDLSKIRTFSWKLANKELLKVGLLFIARKLGGPWAWLASKALPIILDKVIRPVWLKTGRKISKSIRKKVGKKEAKEIRDAETNDDVFDSINRS